MKKSNRAPSKIPAKVPKSGLPKDDVEIANKDIPPKKERQGPVPPPSYTLEDLLAKVPEPTMRGTRTQFFG